MMESKLYLILNILFTLICYSIGEDILGCGGFVQSDLEINFSQVEVKLYTKQGSLKDHTDCAPNNGYYFLPFYDKGEYVLKIEPPSGWSFEPREVALNIDGESDPCSQGKDINFRLLGFAVKGKVLSLGSESGPKNVKVSLQLHTENGLKQSAERLTGDDGSFLFTPVLPGKYTVKIEHVRWQMARDSAVVQVVSGNTIVAAGQLVVGGYDVSGKVTSEDEPIRGVSFVLFNGDKTAAPKNIAGCSKTQLTGFQATNSLCHVTSDAAGLFLFPSLPPGRYRVVPHYEGPQSLQFDVQPKQMEFTVGHDSLVITTPFQVTGFSVSGRVLSSNGGQGLEGATVYLDGKIVGQTQPDGSYQLENMRAGAYKIQVQAKDMKFEEITAKITPNSPLLSPIIPSGFKVCGKVLPYHFQQGGTETASKFILLSKDGSTSPPIVVETKSGSGEFCQFLEPGKYEAKVEVTEIDKNKGLQFFPAGLVINVKDRPILTGVEFSQLKVKLTGTVVCLVSNCPDILINLQSVSADQEKIQVSNTVAVNGKYVFDNILPGTYQVSIDKDDWCWEATNHVVTISSIQSTAPAFKQNGFSITIVSSHDTQVNYKLEKLAPEQAPVTGQFVVNKGTSKSCVKAQGVYEFVPVGCHGYAQHSFKWSTANSATPVQLTATAHTLGGTIVSPDSVSDVYVNVKMSDDDRVKARLGPLKAQAKDDKFVYKFQLLVLEGENIYFEPTANLLLFEPTKLSVVGGVSCVENGVEFTAEKGVIIEGKMVPTSAGIAVTIANEVGDVVIVTETDNTGRFKVGPLPGGIEYRVSAEKEGYVISGPDGKGNFNVHKLAQIDVSVVDSADSKPLQGVLLSLSGADSFRRNSQTNGEGKMTFTSLSPGEYYLRPMMKEYRFEPTSRVIAVKEGATFAVKLAGHRVAFSAYGSVTSLNGEPEEGVVVEAVGIGDCKQQEEASTEATGQFRIRGLQPTCTYSVRVKDGTDANSHIQRGTPPDITVKVKGDIFNLKLIAFQRLTQMDLTAQVSAPTFEHLRTLKLKLCREDIPDSPIHVIRLDAAASKPPRTYQSAMLLFPSIPFDKRAYFLQLESTLPKSAHAFNNYEVHFRANTSFKHVNMVFKPETKVVEQELGQSSYTALVLIALLVVVYFNQDKVVPTLAKLKNSFNDSLVASGNAKKRDDVVEKETETISVEPVGALKRKLKSRKT